VSITLPLRVGIGYDSHRFGEGGPMRLGGVDIRADIHCAGHSDGDAICHAVTDALLGAAALGDIGEMFPDTDPANKGRDSADMLRRAAARVAAAGWRFANLDCVILAQRPKILPHRPAMRRRIAEILGVEESAVWLKAKTGESVGPIGEELAIGAECVVLLERA
jgi:2-C-methyl-D-erythritol 2,4-cyclodiphosphate synthase